MFSQDPVIDEIQNQVDCTVKHGVDPKYDEELGLTGRNFNIVMMRLGAALEERDEQIKRLKQ